MRTKVLTAILLFFASVVPSVIPGAAQNEPAWENAYFLRLTEYMEEYACDNLVFALFDLNFDGIPELFVFRNEATEHIFTFEQGVLFAFSMNDNSLIPQNLLGCQSRRNGTLRWVEHGYPRTHHTIGARYESDEYLLGLEYVLEEYRFDFEQHLIYRETRFERYRRFYSEETGQVYGYRIEGEEATEEQLKKTDWSWRIRYKEIKELYIHRNWGYWSKPTDGDFEGWFHEVVSQYQPTKYEPDDLAVAPADLSPLPFAWWIVRAAGGGGAGCGCRLGDGNACEKAQEKATIATTAAVQSGCRRFIFWSKCDSGHLLPSSAKFALR